MAFEFDRMKEELQVMEWEEKLFNGDPLVLRSLHGKRYYEYVYINSSTYGDDAAWGVWFKHDDKRNFGDLLHATDLQTHNVALIRAAIEAIEIAKQDNFDRLVIFTNSEYLLNFFNDWVFRWMKNGWIKSNGEPVKNQYEWKDLLRAMRGITVKWFPVGENSSDRQGLSEARKLAREAIDNYHNPKSMRDHCCY